MNNKLENVIENFKKSLNNETEYSLKDLIKILEDNYNTIYGNKKGKKKSSTGEKKPPSAYNIFIREEIARIREENLEGVPANEFMKIAAERWKTKKQQIQAENSKE